MLGDEEQVVVEPIDLLAAELLAARDLGLDERDPIRDRELRSRAAWKYTGKRGGHDLAEFARGAKDVALTGAERSSVIFAVVGWLVGESTQT